MSTAEPGGRSTPEGLRDTTQWYLDVDPLAMVDHSLVDLVHAEGGRELLDLGCGTGGYAKVLAGMGHEVKALDVNRRYVEIARGLGVDADHYDGLAIPLPDRSVDTIFLVEVLEHIAEPERLLPELVRVARRNVIITVPNNTRQFSAPVEWGHMLEVDHKHFFTVDSLDALLRRHFGTVDVREVHPIDALLARDVLPRWGFLVYRVAVRLGLVKDRLYFRLVANAEA